MSEELQRVAPILIMLYDTKSIQVLKCFAELDAPSRDYIIKDKPINIILGLNRKGLTHRFADSRGLLARRLSVIPMFWTDYGQRLTIHVPCTQLPYLLKRLHRCCSQEWNCQVDGDEHAIEDIVNVMTVEMYAHQERTPQYAVLAHIVAQVLLGVLMNNADVSQGILVEECAVDAYPNRQGERADSH